MLDNKIIEQFLAILSEELIPAMGCTEPIALAYAAARAREELGGVPDRSIAHCSGNQGIASSVPVMIYARKKTSVRIGCTAVSLFPAC